MRLFNLPTFCSLFLSRKLSLLFSAAILFAASFSVNAGAISAWKVAKYRPLKIVTTTPDLACLVEAIGKDRVQVQSLTNARQNPRYPELKSSAVLCLTEADLLIATGMDLEDGWLPVLVESSANPRLRKGGSAYMDASISVAPLETPDSFLQPQTSPHYLLDPENARQAAAAIKNKICALLSADNAERVEQNYCKFDILLQEKIEKWKLILEPYRGAGFVSDNPAYCYFAERFGFVQAGNIEPAPGRAPSPQHLQNLADQMRTKNIAMIWKRNFDPQKPAQTLSEKTDATILDFQVFPSHIGGQQYIQTIDTIVNKLAKTLQKNPSHITRLGSL